MKILILNSQKDKFYLNKLIKIFKNYEDDKIILSKKKIKLQFIKKKKVDIIISFHYKYIVTSDVLKFVNFNAFNFHNSYLPQNKGMYPVLWSAVFNKFAICLHKMNNKIDEGDIVFRKKIKIDKNKSLFYAYNAMEKSSLNLFKKKWVSLRNKIKSKKRIINIKKNKVKISYNNNFKSQVLLSTLKYKWNTKIIDVQKNYKLICKFYNF